MFNALPSEILVTHRAVMDAQQVARPILVTEAAPVAIQREPGVALGSPLGRADVAFVSVAAIHSVLVVPRRVVPRPILPRLARLCPVMRPYGRIPAQSRLALSRPARCSPNSPSPITPYLAQPRHVALMGVSLSSHDSHHRVQPRRARSGRGRSCRPYGRFPVKPGPVVPRQVSPSTAVSRYVVPSHIEPCPVSRPCGRIPVLPCRATPCSAGACAVLLRRVTPGPAPSCRAGACPVALAGVSLSCPVRPRRATPSRVSSCLAVPVRSTPCPDKQNPEHLRSRDLLKVHGGCTDVRDSTHERATKQPPSREPSAVSVYHSRVVPVNRG